MARKKSSSETEHLRGIIRKQEAQLRELKKQLAKAKPSIIIKKEDSDKEDSSDPEEHCPKCKSKIKLIPLGNKEMLLCSNDLCDYKKLTKSEQS